MANEVLINVGAGETRVAIVEDQHLKEIYIERCPPGDGRGADSDRDGIVGNIYLGTVRRVLPGMQAAFVDVGLERAGFLGAREAKCLAELADLESGDVPPISACVHEGQQILAQVVKDPIADKGARLSANVTLAGRLLVYVPYQPGVALSRRIEDEAERDRMTALLETIRQDCAREHQEVGGFIVRTAAVGMAQDALEGDARALIEEWAKIEASVKGAKPPSIVYRDIDSVERALRDFVDQDTTRMLIDDAQAVEAAKRFCARQIKDIAPAIEHHKGPGPIFDLYGVENALEDALEPTVPLDSGGWITIETTEALTAIDVNSGGLTEETGLEATSVKTNLAAARVIGPQLRLRGIGGLIIVDFIHMDDPENHEKVLAELEAGLSGDRVPFEMSGMSEFGVVEMTRKRVREPLARLMTEDCRVCSGAGRLKTSATVANELLRRLVDEARATPGRELIAVAAPDVVRWIEARRPAIDEQLAKQGVGRVRFERKSPCPRDFYEVAVAEAAA